MLKNIPQKLESVEVNHYYAPYCGELEIAARAGYAKGGWFEIMWYLFKFGYMQGHKAAVSEMKKGQIST